VRVPGAWQDLSLDGMASIASSMVISGAVLTTFTADRSKPAIEPVEAAIEKAAALTSFGSSALGHGASPANGR